MNGGWNDEMEVPKPIAETKFNQKKVYKCFLLNNIENKVTIYKYSIVLMNIPSPQY
jgi:hypothetical protein